MIRQDFAVIKRWVKQDTKVLDLGCGDGTLLSYLRQHKQICGYGVEKDANNWLASMTSGTNVLQMDLEEGLSNFTEHSFDTVILSQTLQAVRNTEHILREMLRVGREAIVTFPNFGYWRLRMQLIFGHMPISQQLPYAWHNTPNVHLCTLADFENLCATFDIVIKERLVLTGQRNVTCLPNLLGNLAMYRLGNASKTVNTMNCKAHATQGARPINEIGKRSE